MRSRHIEYPSSPPPPSNPLRAKAYQTAVLVQRWDRIPGPARRPAMPEPWRVRSCVGSLAGRDFFSWRRISTRLRLNRTCRCLCRTVSSRQELPFSPRRCFARAAARSGASAGSTVATTTWWRCAGWTCSARRSGKPAEHLAEMPPQLQIQRLPSTLRDEDDAVFAVPRCMA